MNSADFIHPAGELLPAFFPNEDLAGLVATWLAEAMAKAAGLPGLPAESVGAATAAWVYFRAYSAVANRIAATPTREAYFNDVDRWHSADRVEFFRAKAEEHLARYASLASAATSGGGGAPVVQRPPLTGSAGVRAAW